MSSSHRKQEQESKFLVNVSATFSDPVTKMSTRSQRSSRSSRRHSYLDRSTTSSVASNSSNPFLSVYTEDPVPPPAKMGRANVPKKLHKKKYLGAAEQKVLDEISFNTFLTIKLQKLNGRSSLARFKKFSGEFFLGEGKLLLRLHKAGASAEKATKMSPLTTFCFEVGSVQTINYRKLESKTFGLSFHDDPHLFVFGTPSAKDTQVVIRMLLNEIKTQAMAFDRAVQKLVEPARFSDLIGKADDGATAELPEQIKSKSDQITELLQEGLECWTLARGTYHDDVFEAQENLAKWFKLIGVVQESKYHSDMLMSRRQEYTNRLKFEMDYNAEKVKITPLEQLQTASDMIGANQMRAQAKKVDLNARAEVLLDSFNSAENVDAMELQL